MLCATSAILCQPIRRYVSILAVTLELIGCKEEERKMILRRVPSNRLFEVRLHSGISSFSGFVCVQGSVSFLRRRVYAGIRLFSGAVPTQTVGVTDRHWAAIDDLSPQR